MTLTIENELGDLAKANLPEVLVEKINNWLSEDSKIKIKEALKKYFNFNKFRVQSVLSSDAWRRLTDNGNLPYLVATKDGDFYFRGAKGKLLCENNFKNVPPGKIYFKDLGHDNYLSVVLLRVE